MVVFNYGWSGAKFFARRLKPYVPPTTEEIGRIRDAYIEYWRDRTNEENKERVKTLLARVKLSIGVTKREVFQRLNELEERAKIKQVNEGVYFVH